MKENKNYKVTLYSLLLLVPITISGYLLFRGINVEKSMATPTDYTGYICKCSSADSVMILGEGYQNQEACETSCVENYGAGTFDSFNPPVELNVTNSSSSDTVSVDGITVKPKEWTIGIGEQKTIYPTVTPEGATNKKVTYSSSSNSTVTVDENGVITGVSASSNPVVITATTEDGNYTATTQVTVVGSSTTSQIMDVRNGNTFTKLEDTTGTNIHKDEDLEKESSTSLAYPFGLGCEIGEDWCYGKLNEDIKYSGIYETDGSITLEEVKDTWNNDPFLSENDNKNNRWDLNGMNDGKPTLAINSIKNKYSVIYKNAGKWKGKDVDIKATIVDFEPMQDERYLISKPAITLTAKKMGVAVTGIKWAKVKYEFLDSNDNTKRIKIKGNATYWEIDLNQGIIINSDDTNKGIFYVNSGLKYNSATDRQNKTPDDVTNQLYYKNLTDGIYIFDHNSGFDQSIANPLYADDLQSTAYAFTEEFEGEEIVRTFQFSNPVFKNAANENVWNGHGAMYISSTPIISEKKYAITTEAENGEIEPAREVFEGGDVIIKYYPDDGYELSYIEVDDEKQDLKGITTGYLFENVTRDHHIKVVYVKSNTSSPKTGLLGVGGVLIVVLAAGGVAYFLTKKKQISNI